VIEFWKSPNNWYQSLFLTKRVFDPNSKIKVLQTCFLTYHRVEDNQKNPLLKTRRRTDVLHARTRPHAPTSRLPTRTNAPYAFHAPSSPGFCKTGRADPPRHHLRTVTVLVTCHVTCHVIRLSFVPMCRRS